MTIGSLIDLPVARLEMVIRSASKSRRDEMFREALEVSRGARLVSPEVSLQWAELALRFSSASPTHAVLAHVELAHALRSKGLLRGALRVTRDVASQVDSGISTEARRDYYSCLASVLIDLEHGGDARHVLGAAEELASRHALVEVRLKKGRALSSQGDQDGAWREYVHAAHLAEDCGSDHLVAVAVFNLVCIHAEKGEVAAALEAVLRARPLLADYDQGKMGLRRRWLETGLMASLDRVPRYATRLWEIGERFRDLGLVFDARGAAVDAIQTALIAGDHEDAGEMLLRLSCALVKENLSLPEGLETILLSRRSRFAPAVVLDRLRDLLGTNGVPLRSCLAG